MPKSILSDDNTQAIPAPFYDRAAIFHEAGPFNPHFMHESVRTLMRSLPLDPSEPKGWQDRRMYSALLGLSALHPRDEIEVMLGVQAMSAYHAAAACWRIGMNHHCPNGDSTRHITTAATAARTFDTMLRALERRQVKPLAIPIGRPDAQDWADCDPPEMTMQKWVDRCSRDKFGADPSAQSEPAIAWTPMQLAAADAFLEQERIQRENQGLDLANTEGILPGGGMIFPENPTPQQDAYMARRVGLMYKREYEENLRKGIKKYPKIRGIKPGDLIP